MLLFSYLLSADRKEGPMIELSIVTLALSFTWPTWKRLVSEVEPLGFAGLFRAEHLTTPWPTDVDTLDLSVSLTYLADHTQRVPFGPLVAPLSFHDPVMLARQAAALDDLSSGRMILGVGAGWMEREHTMFGYTLGNVPTRMARLQEGLEVITRLLHSAEPVTYTGQFYRLQEAVLRPRPQRPGGPPLLIGGSGLRRTLPLVARYADIWNASHVSPEAFRERSAHLDELLREVGRQPGDVKRTVIAPVICGRDRTELDQRVSGVRRLIPNGAQIPLDALLDGLRTHFANLIVGTPEQVVEQIRAFERAGCEELMAGWFTIDDLAGLHLLAEQVLPQLAS
jgi:alkanesulfonate monooxygenase SsuD/methylene tetrahydromethanopterin reductase-like flavin-dependent oxidoreductase (luciferase family)